MSEENSKLMLEQSEDCLYLNIIIPTFLFQEMDLNRNQITSLADTWGVQFRRTMHEDRADGHFHNFLRHKYNS
jgi:hypothetical protein